MQTTSETTVPTRDELSAAIADMLLESGTMAPPNRVAYPVCLVYRDGEIRWASAAVADARGYHVVARYAADGEVPGEMWEGGITDERDIAEAAAYYAEELSR